MSSAAGDPGWFDTDHPAPPPPPAGSRPAADAPAQQPQVDLTIATPPAPRRFDQLTHASFHAPNGDGGWQVKEVTGRITPDEQRLLERRAAAFQSAELSKLPAFLGQGEVDRLPRRLVYGPVDPARPGAATAYWHAVPAGEDSSRRPGNVFTHVVLDREPGAPRPPLRPSDLLRSPAWLRPYGAQQVLGATVAGRPVPTETGPVLDRAAVLAFLVDKALWRGGTLRGLLDAVHAAMRRGPAVVLGAVKPEDADRWVAAVCHLMSPGTSRRLFFSTAEHVGGLAAARAARLHLVVVPAAELRTVEPDDTVVLISDEDLVDGRPAVEFVDFDVDETEQVHVTAYGSRIRATPWSAIAAAILRDEALAAELLDRQDAIAAEVGDRTLSCAWPLALAVVEHGLDHPGTGAADVLDEALPAARMVAQDAPPGIAGTRLQQVVQRLQEQAFGRTAADAWTVLQGRLPAGTDRYAAIAFYLKLALHDRQWLLRDGGVPLPDMFGAVSQVGDTVVVQAHATLDELRNEPGGGDPTGDPATAAVALRLLDLVARAGLAAHLDAARADDVLERVARPVLLHPLAGPGLVERVGPVTETTQARFVRPWLDRLLPQLTGRPGCRLAPAVLRWLFPIAPALPPATAVPPATLAEAAAQAALVLPDPSSFRAVALIADATGPPGGPPTRADRGPGLPLAAMVALLDRFPPRRLVGLLGPTLLSAPTGPDLDDLLERLRPEFTADRPGPDTPAGRALWDALELRGLETSWQRPGEGDDPHRPAFRRFARLLRPLVHEGVGLAADLLVSGSAADVVDRIHGFDEAAGRPLIELRRSGVAWTDADAMTALARRVVDAARVGIVADQQVFLAAQLAALELDGVVFGPKSWGDLADLSWTTPSGRRERLLDHVVWLRLTQVQREAPDKVDRLMVGTRDWVERATDENRARVDPHRAVADYERSVRVWWHRLGVRDDDLRRVLHRRGWRSS